MTKYLKQIALLVGFSIFLIGKILSQDIEFKGANFKDDKDGLKAAIENIEKGTEALELGNEAVVAVNDVKDYFQRALFYFEKAQVFNPNSSELNYKIGNALLYTNRKYEAKEYLDKSLKLNPSPDPMFYYYYAQVMQLELEYKRALDYIDKFISEAKSKRAEELKKFTSKFKKECKSAPEVIDNPVRAWVDNISSVNSENDDYSPCVTADGEYLIFTSKRKNAHEPNDIGAYDGDIYESTFVQGEWTSAKNLGGPLSTEADETASGLGYDGQRMLLFSYKETNADVLESKLNGLNWGNPEIKFSSNINSDANETYASYEPQDIKVFFIYDGKLNGDKDIYFSGIMDKSRNTWGKGQSVGSQVNTSFNEGSVFIHPNGRTMYFSSQGHNSIGGYDIYKADLVQGIWTNPVNLGYPINTPYDDMFFAFTANEKYAYISSNRAGGQGGMDIYQVTYWGPEKEVYFDGEDQLLASHANPVRSIPLEKEVKVDKKSLTVFKGQVIDFLTKKPLQAELTITDNSTGEVISDVLSNSATGKFLLSLPSGRNYGISVNKEGYLFHSENFNLPEYSEFNMVNKDVEMKNIAVGSKIALRNVFFATGKADITSESNAELKRLIDLLNAVPRLKIELSGHTDNTGSESLNQKLSQERAGAVKQYLISKGISSDRLVAKGYGSSRPVGTNDSKEGRQNNRRTEYEIIAN
ncbi:MAG: OmpA family protein [Vicingaceae bacterium]